MATVYKSGERWIVEVYRRGKIRVGKNQRTARQVHAHVDQLEQCIKYDTSIPDATVQWIRNIDQKLRDRLTVLKLIPSFKHRTIIDLTSAYKNSKSKLTTTINQTIDSLHRFFGEDHFLKDVDTIAAADFKIWLQTSGRKKAIVVDGRESHELATATVSARIKKTREMFRKAVRAKWITENPFEDVVAGKQSNPDRLFYVKPELADQILEELPTVELRLIFALGRWGGFRLPSEAENLRWSDINWDRASMTFRAKKLEHLEGFEFRTCPIFAQLRPWLDAAWDQVDGPAEYCCPWLRSQSGGGQSFTKHLKLVLRRIGVEPWPRLLNNLRATRATEVDDEFGSKAESQWIGHGAETAMKHYLMVTDEKWARAVKSVETAADSVELSSEK